MANAMVPQATGGVGEAGGDTVSQPFSQEGAIKTAANSQTQTRANRWSIWRTAHIGTTRVTFWVSGVGRQSVGDARVNV
jgi:hypothetical protein